MNDDHDDDDQDGAEETARPETRPAIVRTTPAPPQPGPRPR